MANFKTHISWGIICATVVTVGGLIYLSLDVQCLFVIFIAIIIGSFLPDVDSDSSVPFQIIFGSLSAGLAGFSFYVLYIHDAKDYIFFIAIPVIVFIFVRFVLGELFRRFTHHRGIWHSIPAAVLLGLLTIHLLNAIHFLDSREMLFYIGGAISLGYVIHLILDEIYATINLSGHSLLPKKSFGSALKLYSSSKIVTFGVYGSIVFLLLII